MQSGIPKGDNVRIHGKSQGYLGLAVNHFRYEDGTNEMITVWTPTPDELEKLNKGAGVQVHMLGDLPPPMKVTVSDPPD